jgi:hypothetical protein
MRSQTTPEEARQLCFVVGAQDPVACQTNAYFPNARARVNWCDMCRVVTKAK